MAVADHSPGTSGTKALVFGAGEVSAKERHGSDLTHACQRFDVEEWRAKPRAERTKALQQHWAVYGFGTPYAIYLLYALKIGLYVLGGLLFAAATPGIGSLGNLSDWWFEPVVFQKVIIWTLLFEVLGFGCGFGPLTMRFLPPIGTFLYWLRPGTIRQPPWPDRVPGTRDRVAPVLDVGLYVGVIAAAVYRAAVAGRSRRVRTRRRCLHASSSRGASFPS